MRMKRLWQFLNAEPLILFSILGGILFVVYGIVRPVDDLETIEISPSTLQVLQQSQQNLVGRPLTETEQLDVVEGYIEDEVLLREAFRMGLERQDSRVRRRLLNVMRSTLDQPVAQPGRAELQAYFREHRDRYVTDEVITLEQVFFGFGSPETPDDAQEFLKRLREGGDPSQFGESGIFGSVLRDRTARQLRGMLGVEFAEQAFLLALQEWHGPLESSQGIHFVRVLERKTPPEPSFDQLEEYLRQDWMFRKRRELQSDRISEMRARYRIVYLEE